MHLTLGIVEAHHVEGHRGLPVEQDAVQGGQAGQGEDALVPDAGAARQVQPAGRNIHFKALTYSGLHPLPFHALPGCLPCQLHIASLYLMPSKLGRWTAPHTSSGSSNVFLDLVLGLDYSSAWETHLCTCITLVSDSQESIVRP